MSNLIAAPYYKWIVVAVLWLVGFLNEVDRHAIFAIFPVLEKDLGMSKWELGLLGTAFLWAYAFFGPQAGYFGDRFPRRRVIMISLFAWSAMTALNALATSGAYLIALRALLAVSEAFYMPAALALITEHHTERTRSTAVAIHLSAFALGQVGGGFLGGYMAEHYNWRTLFVALGAAGIAYIPVLALLLYPPAAENRSARGISAEANKMRMSFLSASGDLARIPTLRFFAFAFLCYSVVGTVMQTWLPYFIFHKFHTSLTAAGFSAALYLQLPTAMGNFVGAGLGDFWATRKFRGRILVQAISLAVSAPFLFALGVSGTLTGVAVSLILIGLLRGGWPPNVMPVIFQIVPDHLRATTYGFLNCIGNVGGGLAAVLASNALGTRLGMGAAFAGFSTVHLFAAVCLFFAAGRRLKQDFLGESSDFVAKAIPSAPSAQAHL